MRNAFAKEVTRLSKKSSKLVLLSGDIGNRLFDDYKAIPNSNFINCGIAEANMMGVAAGFEDAAATTVVSEGIINALEAGDFHLFPDEMAKQIEAAYQSFSDNVVMVDFSE